MILISISQSSKKRNKIKKENPANYISDRPGEGISDM